MKVNNGYVCIQKSYSGGWIWTTAFSSKRPACFRCTTPLISDAICFRSYKKVINKILYSILALTMTQIANHVIFFCLGDVKRSQNILQKSKLQIIRNFLELFPCYLIYAIKSKNVASDGKRERDKLIRIYVWCYPLINWFFTITLI